MKCIVSVLIGLYVPALLIAQPTTDEGSNHFPPLPKDCSLLIYGPVLQHTYWQENLQQEDQQSFQQRFYKSTDPALKECLMEKLIEEDKIGETLDKQITALEGIIASIKGGGIGPLVGPAGPVGQPGAPGPSGYPGFPGPSGPAGPQGFTGIMGRTGVDGQPGFRGFTGLPGPVGPRGNTGLMGTQGRTGEQGSTGYAGHNGAVGPYGSDGQKGKPGLSGPPIGPGRICTPLEP